MRRSADRQHQTTKTFQFTHPGRGATRTLSGRLKEEPSFNSRTPGGVRLRSLRTSAMVWMFQFTHPGRGATRLQLPLQANQRQFQFTHPGRGATWTRGFIILTTIVSIHAPREGCDTLRGYCPPVSRMFQFTHPGRGATSRSTVGATRRRRVSIHAPREGCDCRGVALPPIRACFNSRTPGGVRPIFPFISITDARVSIHAPREGCDVSDGAAP